MAKVGYYGGESGHIISYLFHKLFLDDFIKKKIWNVRDVMGHGAKNFMIGTNVNFFGQD